MLLTPASNYWQYPRRHDLSNPCLLGCSAVQCLQYSTTQNSTVQLCHGSSTIKIMKIVPNHQELELNIAKNRDIENDQSVSNVTSSIMMDSQSSLCAFEHRVIPIESDRIVPDRATSLLCSSRVARRCTTKKAATTTATLSTVGREIPMVLTTPQNHTRLPVSLSFRWTFDVDHEAIVEHGNAYSC